MTQRDLGYLAGFGTSAATNVCSAETGRSMRHIDAIRRALIWAEAEPRRLRAAERADAVKADAVETALLGPGGPEADEIIVARMVDLLLEGRDVEFDNLSACVDSALSDRAGDVYLDSCTPRQSCAG
jgi:hypothetical protein